MKPLLKTGYTIGGFFNSFVGELLESPHEARMREALTMSMSACGITAPNPAVGCVVYHGEKKVVQGATREFRGEHAERVALTGFQGRAEECDFYVTLEPCSHHGYQPPCVDLVKQYPWKNIFVASRDPNPKVAGGGINQLKNVSVGLLQNEARAWNLPFFFQQIYRRPLIVGKWAETKDGFMAQESGASKWISNEQSRQHVHWLRQKYDAILVGAETFLRDQPLLNVRLKSPTRQPLRIIWDPKNKIGKNLFSEEFTATQQKTLILKSPQLAQVLISSEFQAQLGAELGKPLQSIFVEGGCRTLQHLHEADAIDAVHVFRSPKEFNSSRYKSPFDVLKSNWAIISKSEIAEDVLIEAMPQERMEKIFYCP